MGYALIDESSLGGLPKIVVVGPSLNELFWKEVQCYMEDLYGETIRPKEEDLYGETIRPKEEYQEAYINDEEVGSAERQFYDLQSGVGVEGWTLDEDVIITK